MKHLKLFEEYHFSKDQIRSMLLKAQKKSKIELKVDVDDLLNDLKETSNIFGFDYFVENEAKFISEGDYQRMGEYIEKFKNLGLNTTKIEELYPKLIRYKEIQFKELDYNDSVQTKLYKEMNSLEPFVFELQKEVKKLAIEAKKIMEEL